jgi:hypothetical protein
MLEVVLAVCDCEGVMYFTFNFWMASVFYKTVPLKRLLLVSFIPIQI